MNQHMNLKSILPWKKEERRPARKHADGDPFTLLQQRMNGLFDDFFGRPSSELWNRFSGGFAPQIDVSESDQEVRITAELPGLDEKEVDVTLSANLLTIKGDKREEQEEEKGNFWHSERHYGYFERTVQLPQGVDTDKAKAQFKKGVLKVTIPKRPEAQTSRRKIELLSD
jgi:HSP20 family protein